MLVKTIDVVLMCNAQEVSVCSYIFSANGYFNARAVEFFIVIARWFKFFIEAGGKYFVFATVARKLYRIAKLLNEPVLNVWFTVECYRVIHG